MLCANAAAAVLVVRPEAVGLDGALPVWVTATRFAGSDVLVDSDLSDGQSLRARVPLGTRLAVGDLICLEVPPQRCTVFPRPAEEAP